MSDEHFHTFRNDVFPAVLVDADALYCGACLEDQTVPVLNKVSEGEGDIRCTVHGLLGLYGPHGQVPVSGRALGGFMLLSAMGQVQVPEDPVPKINASPEAMEMRVSTVRKYVAGDWKGFTVEEVALLEDDATNGVHCKKSAEDMLARIRLEKAKLGNEAGVDVRKIQPDVGKPAGGSDQGSG